MALKQSDVDRIKQALDGGMSATRASGEFHVSHHTARAIKNGTFQIKPKKPKKRQDYRCLVGARLARGCADLTGMPQLSDALYRTSLEPQTDAEERMLSKVIWSAAEAIRVKHFREPKQEPLTIPRASIARAKGRGIVIERLEDA